MKPLIGSIISSIVPSGAAESPDSRSTNAASRETGIPYQRPYGLRRGFQGRDRFGGVHGPRAIDRGKARQSGCNEPNFRAQDRSGAALRMQLIGIARRAPASVFDFPTLICGAPNSTCDRRRARVRSLRMRSRPTASGTDKPASMESPRPPRAPAFPGPGETPRRNGPCRRETGADH
jgi:hypothetical protein